MIGIYKLDKTDKKAFREEILRISQKWSPYRTYACLHLWRWKDNAPLAKKTPVVSKKAPTKKAATVSKKTPSRKSPAARKKTPPAHKKTPVATRKPPPARKKK
jgi:hypothetical protein